MVVVLLYDTGQCLVAMEEGVISQVVKKRDERGLAKFNRCFMGSGGPCRRRLRLKCPRIVILIRLATEVLFMPASIVVGVRMTRRYFRLDHWRFRDKRVI